MSVILLVAVALAVGLLSLLIWLVWEGFKAARLQPESPRFKEIFHQFSSSVDEEKKTQSEWSERILNILEKTASIAVIAVIALLLLYFVVDDLRDSLDFAIRQPLAFIEIALVVIVVLLMVILSKLKSK